MSWLSDLGTTILDLGKDEFRSHVQAHYGTDHIQAQNDTVAYIGQVIHAVHAGQCSASEGVALIEKAVDAFVVLANRSGERGRQGAADVSALAAQVIRDLGGTPSPPGGVPGLPTPRGWTTANLESYLPWLIVGGALFLMSRGRR